MNYRLEQLTKNLLAEEQDEARDLYNAARAVGLGPLKGAALCYRAGRLAGREECVQKMKAAYKQLQAARDRIAALETTDEAPTPGDETEAENHE